MHTLRPDPWPAALAVLAGIVLSGLLIAFVQVVRAGMAQGDSRRRAVAEAADAAWRCNTLPGRADPPACTTPPMAARTSHAAVASRRP